MAGKPDVMIDDQGTIWRFVLLSPRAQDWTEEHVDVHLHCITGGKPFAVFAADWRCAQAIAEGMIAEGFLVSTD